VNSQKTFLLTVHVHTYKMWLSLLEAIFLSLIKQVCFGTAEIDYLWTTISLKYIK